MNKGKSNYHTKENNRLLDLPISDDVENGLERVSGLKLGAL